jgi:hypothetical protein
VQYMDERSTLKPFDATCRHVGSYYYNRIRTSCRAGRIGRCTPQWLCSGNKHRALGFSFQSNTTMHFRRQDEDQSQALTPGVQLGDPTQGIDLVLPLSISQCDHFLVFYNVTQTSDDASSTSGAAIEFGNVGESRVFFTLKPPEGAGYLDWVCDIPAGRRFTARNGGREYSYTVDAGSSGCLGVRTTTSFQYASYSVPIFTSYTARRSPSTTAVPLLEYVCRDYFLFSDTYSPPHTDLRSRLSIFRPIKDFPPYQCQPVFSCRCSFFSILISPALTWHLSVTQLLSRNKIWLFIAPSSRRM